MAKTPDHVADILTKRIRRSQGSFLIFFLFTLILNVILSHYADPKHPKENYSSYGAKYSNYTISHSMTGLYSKTMALFLIFLCNLYYLSIVTYQFSVFKVMYRELHNQNRLSVAEAQLMWKINALANGIATWSALFLQGLVIFDAYRFKPFHFVFAGLFFFSCAFYIMLMMRNEKRLVALGLTKGNDKWNFYTFIAALAFFAMFVAFTVWDHYAHFSGCNKNNDGLSVVARFCLTCQAIGEYGYMICCVILISSSNYSRSTFLKHFDFSELLQIRIFSIQTVLYDCLLGGEWKYIFKLEDAEEDTQKSTSIVELERTSSFRGAVP